MKRYMHKFCVLLFFTVILFATNVSAHEEVKDFKILSKVALLYDRTYNQILYEKNADVRVPNASTTKILTAIVAYENSNMDDVVYIGKNAARIGGSRVGLSSGDKVKMEDLMKGLLISSGNDAAVAIAEHVAGTVELFCNMMNERAKELGAYNTNFTSPHGLDDENHYSTAKDLVIFSNYLLDNDYLANIVNLPNAEIFINGYPKNIRTTNEMISIFDDVNGIKTGFTGNAGRCLVTSAYKDGREIIIVVLGAETKKQRTTDTKTLYKHAYENFEVIDLYADMQKEFEISVSKSKEKKYVMYFSGVKEYLVEKGKNKEVEYRYFISRKQEAPLKIGEILGKIEISLNGECVENLLLKNNVSVQKMEYKDYFYEIILEKMKYIEFNA